MFNLPHVATYGGVRPRARLCPLHDVQWWGGPTCWFGSCDTPPLDGQPEWPLALIQP
jgi:hypothetical protein